MAKVQPDADPPARTAYRRSVASRLRLAPSKPSVQDQIVAATLVSKHFSEQNYQSYIFFDLKFDAIGLDKPARAIKGKLHLTDLFGETKLTVNWSIDKALAPGESVEEKGTGFKYNQFVDSHQWAKATKLEDMKATFSVASILYQDGSRRDVEQ